MNKTVIIFNGPPGSGKDECAKHFTKLNSSIGSIHEENKSHLLQLALLITGLDEDEWMSRYLDRELKDTPWDKCGGLSQREFYIKISEEWCKPLFGRDYFGKRSADRVKKSSASCFFFSDGGFHNETTAIRNGCDNMVIFRLHRDGYDFSNDSRDYIYMGRADISEFDINNDGTLQDMYTKVQVHLKEIL
tara:strand:+ start:428 stop:997 length:570 start_codon:yes stop_codon:yes gene_type:complete